MSSKFSRRSTSKLGEYRFVHFNTPQTAEHKFCSNSIKTSLCARERGPRAGNSAGLQQPFLCRYSWWNFLPKIFFEEFSKVPYMYFGVRPPAAAPRSRNPATDCERDPTHVQLAHRRLPHPAWARARNRP